ncbi:hypothetical protein GCM10025857_06120 [Alicyclobacillus contaminans]|uniref:methyl-accepting chemotaxis protein n=1 Tax=Alicyclobacillus contaminans TaxID=392016 RepID=UPI00040C4A42|nr:methyl-accepting chemotaxis protein [Alicyclobacillus contaminans]GMA49255.1 hypothetical protein GCM10025857_06120 [Alicyclobacillus contaminans]
MPGASDGAKRKFTMQEIRLTVRQKLMIAFSVIGFFSVLLGVLSFLSFSGIQASSEEVLKHAIPINQTVNSLMQDLLNEETGIRGYYITQDKQYLQPYVDGSAQAVKDLKTLRSFESAYPQLKPVIEQQLVPAESLVQSSFDGLQVQIQTGQLSSAKQNLDAGKAAMDDFRVAYSAVEKIAGQITSRSEQRIGSTVHIAYIAMSITLIVSIVIGVFMLMYLRKTVVLPIRRVANQLRDIAEGEGDLTRHLDVATNDEIGDLAHHFNNMVDGLRQLIGQVGLNAEQVAASSEELTASAEQTSRSTEHIASTMQEVASGAERQAQGVSVTAGHIVTMTTGLKEIVGHAESVVSAAEKANAVAMDGSTAVRHVVEQMNAIREEMGRLSEKVMVLGNRSKEIVDVVKLIRGIADQTNLLALNAAIEAARAGEHGRGFAVVADEVRKLAEESAQSAGRIAELVQTIRVETHGVVSSMENATGEVKKGVDTVTEAGMSFEQILIAVSDVKRRVQEVLAVASQIQSGAGEVEASIVEIDHIAVTTASETQTVAAAAEEQLASMEEITSSAANLSLMAEELQKLVGKFKV